MNEINAMIQEATKKQEAKSRTETREKHGCLWKVEGCSKRARRVHVCQSHENTSQEKAIKNAPQPNEIQQTNQTQAPIQTQQQLIQQFHQYQQVQDDSDAS